MNAHDAAQLLMHAAAFDNRQPSKAAAEAWAAALHDIPADADALTAVARYYSTPPARPGDRLWIQPHDVRTYRQAIRDERLEGFVYEPVPGDDDPKVYLAAYRTQRAAVARGERPADRTPAITSNPERMRHIVAGVGRTIPTDQPEPSPERSPLTVRCPKCAARLGHHCRWPGGGHRPTHAARKRAARGEPAEIEQTA